MPAAVVSPSPGSRQRILIVDDQSTARSILREILRGLDFETVEAADGTTALELIGSESFCLVMLDLILPDISGLNILHKIRGQFSYHDLPVIVVSIKDESQDIVEALTSGANDYITKPIDREVLTARVRTHLAHWSAENELRDSHFVLEDSVRARTAELEEANRVLLKEVAERRKAEEALGKFAMMVNAASDLLSFIDRDFRYLAANESFLETFGVRESKVIGSTIDRTFAKEVFESEVRPKLQLCLKGVRVATLLDVKLPGKGIRQLDVRFDPYRDEHQHITGVVINARDISERQRAANAMRTLAQETADSDNNRFFNTCVQTLASSYDAAYAIISVLDTESGPQPILRTLAAWADGQLIDNLSYPAVGAPCLEVLDGQTVLVSQQVQNHYPNCGYWTQFNAQSYLGMPMRGVNGDPLGLVAVMHTRPIESSAWSRQILGTFSNRLALELERNRAMQASEYSASLSHATLESTRGGVLVVDNERRIRNYNQQFLSMWRISEAELERLSNDTRRIFESVADQLLDPDEFLARTEEAYQASDEDTFDVLYFKDGRVFEHYSKPHRLNEQVIGRVASFRDTTEQVHAERELKDYKNNLEALVQSRTAELEAVNREIASFSYSVSHDLRAPLRSIDGFSKMLLEDYASVLDDNARVYLDRIRNASQRMGTLIDDVLLLSRLSRRELSILRVDLSKIGADVASKLAESEPERTVAFYAARSLQANGDPQLIRILLENLIGNAWKYTRKNPEPVIELGATRDNDVNTYFVRDNGVGFDMRYVDKLFQPFQRLHSTQEFEGTGIGLATVAQIVRRHGGDVWAEGKLNVGTTIYFTLGR